MRQNCYTMRTFPNLLILQAYLNYSNIRIMSVIRTNLWFSLNYLFFV
jgi:hypothetical protein